MSHWRVRVRRSDGVITHDSSFDSIEQARDYYDSVYIPGSDKTMELRAPGRSRYTRVVLEVMKADPS
jgi:hypothetical protein